MKISYNRSVATRHPKFEVVMDTPTRFRDYHPDQLMLLPPDLREWLPKDHKAYFILDIVGELDLSSIYGSYDGSKGGQPPYEPRMMVGLLLYAYCEGIHEFAEDRACLPAAGRRRMTLSRSACWDWISILITIRYPRFVNGILTPCQGCSHRCLGFARRGVW